MKTKTEEQDLTFTEKKQFWESIESPKEDEPKAPEIEAVIEKRSQIPVPKTRDTQAINQTNQKLVEEPKVQPIEIHSDVQAHSETDYEEETQSKAQFFIGNNSEAIITKASTERRVDYAFDNQGYQSTSKTMSEYEIKDEHGQTVENEEKNQLPIDKSEIETSEKEVESTKEIESVIESKLLENSTAEVKHDGITFNDITAEPIVVETIVQNTEVEAPYVKQPGTLVLHGVTSIDEMTVEQTLNEVKDSIDAIIEVVKDGQTIKESPSEFEFKPLAEVKYSDPIVESYYEETLSQGDISLGEKIVEKAHSEIISEANVVISPDTTIQSPIPLINEECIVKNDQTTPMLRPKSANNQRWSLIDPENNSGSELSQHHSFERTDSRPLSSDMENYMTSEYQTAADQISFKIGSTTEYVTAASTFDHTNSSHESMKSFTSESSGQLGSIEVSEATETLIPSAMDAEMDNSDLEDEEPDTKCGSFEEKGEAVLLEFDANDSTNLMKRSHEMNFKEDDEPVLLPEMSQSSSEILLVLEDAKRVSDVTVEEIKISSSLDEGSILSVSMSSTTYEADTIVENLPENAGLASLSGSLIGSFEAPSRFHEEISSLVDKANTLDEPTTPTTEYTMESAIQEEILIPIEVTQEINKKSKGHKRNESTSFSNFTGFEMSNQSSQDLEELNEEMIVHESVPSIPFDSVLRMDDKRDSESDSDYDRYETEYSRAFKLPSEGNNKSKRQNEIKPELFDKDKDIRRSRSPSQSFIEPILEDVNAETEHEEEPQIRKISQTTMDLSNLPNITITDDLNKNDSDEEPFMRKDYEATIKSTPLKESHITQQASEVMEAKPSLSYAQEVVYKMSEDEYQETLAQKYEAQEQAHLTYKLTDRESPSGSDSFEMLDQPDLVDDFVVIEEVAKEADEFDTEGRSLRIQKTKIVKKHDEEVEKLIVKSAPADPSEGSMLYAATHDELGFEFEDSPPLDPEEIDHEEYNKRWIEMQRAVLEDIKEEETDFEVGSSRISSFKDSFSSTPEYDIHKKLKLKEHDAMSVNSLQEFESLEQAISLENRKFVQGSMDSLSNGSFPKKFYGRSIEGDGISLSSLREFEGLEDACLEAHLLEIRAKEEAALLSRSDESNKSDDAGKVKTVKTTTTLTRVVYGQSPDKSQKAATEKQIERTSVVNVMETSMDSLEGGSQQQKIHGQRRDSADSLDNIRSTMDLMTSSIDSIEVGRDGAQSCRSEADSLDFGQIPNSQSIDSIDFNEHLTKKFDETQTFTHGNPETVVRTTTTVTTSSTVYPTMTIEKDISSDSLNLDDQHLRQLTTSESMEYTSSTATNATYKNNTDSQMSSSVTSCDSTTMIDNVDHMVLSTGT